MNKHKHEWIDYALLTMILAAAVALNLVMKVPPSAMAIPLAGIFFYLVLTQSDAYDRIRNYDYLQTGEGAICAAGFFMAVRFLSTGPLPVFLWGFLSLLIYEVFIAYVIAPQKNESLAGGLISMAATVIVIAYLAATDRSFHPAELESIAAGYFTAIPQSIGISASFAGAGALLALAALLFDKELRLFSQGPYFYPAPRPVTTLMTLSLLAARSFLVAASFAYLGLLSGFGLYARIAARGRFHRVKTALLIVVYSQTMILLVTTAGVWPAAGVSLALSYASCLYATKRRVYLYDRNQ